MHRKYFILWDIVNPQSGSGLGLWLGLGLGSGLGLGLGSGLGLDSVHGSTISHKMKYLPHAFKICSLSLLAVVLMYNKQLKTE